jgi:hypothetical protein
MSPTVTPAPPAGAVPRLDVTDVETFAPPPGNALQLLLGTGAFAVCFAIFGSVSAMMPLLRQRLGLGPVEVSIALAVPVLLGSLGRIPLGILTDRYGGRAVFLAVLAAAVLAGALLGWVDDYGSLLACGLFVGIALASFSVGVGFVSGWYPPQRQGTGPGHLRRRQHRAVAGGLRRPGAGGGRGAAGLGLLGLRPARPGLDGAVLPAGPQRPAPRPGQAAGRLPPPLAPRHELGAEPVLLPDLRRLRGHGHLPADLPHGYV